jgi:hypothetical protein
MTFFCFCCSFELRTKSLASLTSLWPVASSLPRAPAEGAEEREGEGARVKDAKSRNAPKKVV